ncbi:MAG: type II CAAX endopeptidase family protein [Chitinophagales bacterium]
MQPEGAFRPNSTLSIIVGFLLLFFVYHIPEFLQRQYQQPLLWCLEIGMLFFVILYFFILSIQNKKAQDSGLSDFRKLKRNLYTGISIGILLTVGLNFVTVLLGWNSITITGSFASILGQSFLFAIGTFLPSLAEDLLTRSYLFAHWPQRWNRKWLLFISAFIYAANHIFRLNRPDVMLYLSALGILLMACLLLTRSLWLTLGIHWGANIAYQFFANIASIETKSDTGYENYLLAGFYVTGLLIVYILWKTGIVKSNP